jgi:hypothetical protein
LPVWIEKLLVCSGKLLGWFGTAVQGPSTHVTMSPTVAEHFDMFKHVFDVC